MPCTTPLRQGMNSTPKPVVLCVDDEPEVLKLLEEWLSRSGLGVTAMSASDGPAALRSVAKTTPDLILLDIIMPGMSGFEFMETMTTSPEYRKPPVIIISNLGQESDIKRGESLGAVGYFVKAKISMDEILQNIEVFFSKAK